MLLGCSGAHVWACFSAGTCPYRQENTDLKRKSRARAPKVTSRLLPHGGARPSSDSMSTIAGNALQCFLFSCFSPMHYSFMWHARSGRLQMRYTLMDSFPACTPPTLSLARRRGPLHKSLRPSSTPTVSQRAAVRPGVRPRWRCARSSSPTCCQTNRSGFKGMGTVVSRCSTHAHRRASAPPGGP